MSKIVVEKIGEYKKYMKSFIKGAVRSKLFQDADGNMTVVITKTYDKETNYREVVLRIDGADTGVYAEFTAETPTRVFNKIEPGLFAPLGEQLSKGKNFGKLIVE